LDKEEALREALSLLENIVQAHRRYVRYLSYDPNQTKTLREMSERSEAVEKSIEEASLRMDDLWSSVTERES
jgi:uncharacterized protein with GYD domain